MKVEKLLSVFIPAIKKNVIFQDDLVKKLAGISLIQRAINIAVELCADKSYICVLTDSEEIRLIAKRSGVRAYYDPNLTWSHKDFDVKIVESLKQYVKESKHILWFSPYAPLLTVDLINSAIQSLLDSKIDLLKPVRYINRRVHRRDDHITLKSLFNNESELIAVNSNAFVLMRTDLLLNNYDQKISTLPWSIDHDMLDIETFQDWWVCEKLLTRKRIIFRVIGNNEVGMGHIYRALSLAHEVTDHEVLFVCDCNDSVVVNKLAGYDYWLGIYNSAEMMQKIIDLKPDLVINDILSTTKEEVVPLQESNIKVVNFEDLGEGASLADITINELYDKPVIAGDKILWGSDYFFVRDEFIDAKPQSFVREVKNILLAFGGTDKYNLTGKMYKAVKDFCRDRGISINIVTGPGFKGFDNLSKEVEREKNVLLTGSTGVISSIMETSQIALVSNGRTVYELAHMNIPSIVISQHNREDTHLFACKENGFLPMGVYKEDDTEKAALDSLKKLTDDIDYRYTFHNRMNRFEFNSNKELVLNTILDIL